MIFFWAYFQSTLSNRRSRLFVLRHRFLLDVLGHFVLALLPVLFLYFRLVFLPLLFCHF